MRFTNENNFGFNRKDCPWKAGEIEHCPAFLQPEYSKHFPCDYTNDCVEEIRRIADEAEGVI